ncbi:flagellar hook-length control protein FliK [Variovorax paradoxus]|nr:flagellar hook-length control protein FliK [Variovorax paradoxus]MBT2300481.1 flagellar hook-length control protein FliK [Variovorax paradoxus]
MNRLSGLVDTLLSAKLAPRLELLALQQSQVGTDAAAGPVVAVQKVVNDIRLPPEMALGRHLPAAGAAAAPGRSVPGQPDAAAPSAARLSVAARVIGALLAEFPDAGPLRGASPMWPSSQQPSPAALAGTLAQTVSASGLFYESHLREFAAGTRTLAQLAQEPQARWAPARSASPEAAAQPVAASATVAAEAPKAVLPGPMPHPDDSASTLPQAAAPRPPAEAGAGDGLLPPRAPAPALAAETSVPAADAARGLAAYRSGEAAPSAAPEAPPAQRAEEASPRHAAAASVQAPPAGEVIHPQTATVVHQQLDLLATAVFRWSGQAWPEVPMAWSIQEEDAEPYGDAPHEPAARSWTTTVSLSLPRLGNVDLRLSLAGTHVQAQLAASETRTAARLRADSDRLVQRFEAAGLRLQELQIAAKATR